MQCMFLLEICFLFYFVLCGLISLAINIFIYDWLSLFTKKSIHLALSILASFSNFGLFFIFVLFLFFSTKLYSYCLNYVFKNFVKNTIKAMKGQIEPKNFLFNQRTKFKAFAYVIYRFIMIIGIIILLFFVIFKWIFYVSAVYEIGMLSFFIFFRFFSGIFNSEDESSIREDSSYCENMIYDNNNNNTDSNNNENDVDSIEISIDTNNNEEIDNNNDNDNLDNNVDIHNILNIEIINNLNKDFIIIDISNIIDGTNSNINILNEKISLLNPLIDKINDLTDSTNEALNNIEKIEKVLRIKIKIKSIEITINSNAMNLNKIIQANENFIKINNIIAKHIFHFTKRIIILLNTFNCILTNPNNNSDKNELKHAVTKINKNINKWRRKIITANKLVEKEEKTIKTKINETIDDESREESSEESFKIFSLVPQCNGMFNNKIQPIKFFQDECKYETYISIVSIIIIGLQLYSIVYPYCQHFFSLWEFFIFFFY